MKKHTRNILLQLAFLGGCASFVSSLATAATSEDKATLALPDLDIRGTAWRAWEYSPGYVSPVTTTGSKTDTALIEAPQSVGIVTRDQIDDQAALSVAQALRYTAGVLSEIRPSPRYDSVFVRGFGGQASSAAFVNFLDGLRLGRGSSFAIPNVDPWLLERIEVLRGPASVLYGQTGAGGLVNLVSRRPTDTPIHELRMEMGSHSLRQGAFDFGGPLLDDGTLLYRLTGLVRKADTQYDFAEEERIAIAPALTWRPNNDTSLTLLASFQRDPEGGYYSAVPASGTVLRNPNGRIGSDFFGGDPNFNRFDRTQYSVGYQAEHRLNDTWTLRQNTRYSSVEVDTLNLFPGNLLNDHTQARTASLVDDHARSIAVDTQAQADFTTGMLHHSLLFGFDWHDTDSRARTLTVPAALGVPSIDLFSPIYYRTFPSAINGPRNIVDQDLEQLGAYVQDQMELGQWRMNIGLRHDRASVDTRTQRAGMSAKSHAQQNDSAITWRTGGLYLFDNGLAPYLNYSTSFLPNSGTRAPERGGDTFAPTEGEQYEAGIKYQPPGYESFVQVAGFQITQENVLTRDTLYPTYSIAQGEIRSRGLEIEGRGNLGEGLDVIASYTRTSSEVTRSNNINSKGRQVQQVPRHMANAWANWKPHHDLLRGLSLGAGVRYVGSTYGDEGNTFKVPNVTLIDAAVRYDLSALANWGKGLEIALNAQNLTDKEYISSCFSSTVCYFGPRRTLLASLRARW